MAPVRQRSSLPVIALLVLMAHASGDSSSCPNNASGDSSSCRNKASGHSLLQTHFGITQLSFAAQANIEAIDTMVSYTYSTEYTSQWCGGGETEKSKSKSGSFCDGSKSDCFTKGKALCTYTPDCKGIMWNQGWSASGQIQFCKSSALSTKTDGWVTILKIDPSTKEESNVTVDCVVSAWTNSGACSKSCGTGVQQRTRHPTTRMENGGVPCPTLSTTTSCNTDACPGRSRARSTSSSSSSRSNRYPSSSRSNRYPSSSRSTSSSSSSRSNRRSSSRSNRYPSSSRSTTYRHSHSRSTGHRSASLASKAVAKPADTAMPSEQGAPTATETPATLGTEEATTQ